MSNLPLPNPPRRRRAVPYTPVLRLRLEKQLEAMFPHNHGAMMREVIEDEPVSPYDALRYYQNILYSLEHLKLIPGIVEMSEYMFRDPTAAKGRGFRCIEYDD